MKRIFRNIYLIFGLLFYIFINYVSYMVEPYASSKDLTYKIVFSVISLLILSYFYVLILKPTLIFKKELKKETLIYLYIGIIIASLISFTF